MKVEAYFRSLKAANDAVGKLKSSGYKDSAADLNDHYIFHNNPGQNRPGLDISSNSQASLVMKSGSPLDDQRYGPLAAASPMVSGMGGFEEVADVNYRVTAEVDEKDEKRVRQMLNDMGGDLRNPNFKMPEGLDNISTDEVISRVLSEANDESVLRER
ncbi:MAG: hypothetical protein Q8930_11580 [Bacillota bacterium]|nr:hypothetical protein [Bacillota bacterium]